MDRPPQAGRALLRTSTGSRAHAGGRRGARRADQLRPGAAVWSPATDGRRSTRPGTTSTRGPLGERVAAGLRELLRDPARASVLVLARLWPQYWDTLTARPAGDADLHAQARELLAGHDITVPSRGLNSANAAYVKLRNALPVDDVLSGDFPVAAASALAELR